MKQGKRARTPARTPRKPAKAAAKQAPALPEYVLGPYGEIISREEFERLYGKAAPPPPEKQR